jgi:hypothetical protein
VEFVVCRPWLFRLLPSPPRGMALYPFILLANPNDRTNPRLMNHERIHLRQQAELLVFPFYPLYLAHYFLNLARLGQHDPAYRQICFEREAYAHDADLGYLAKRKTWAFWGHLKDEKKFF